MRTPLAAALSLLALAAHAAPSMPPPGEYRIDGESSVRSGSGPATSERIERVDGATGNRTVITKAGPPGTPAGQQTYAGTGPVTWCVPAAATAPANLPGRCNSRWWPSGGGATLQADCQAGRMLEQWKQVDARTWERQMTFKASANPANNDPSGAFALAQRGMTPAEQARARAEMAALPSAQDQAGAMAQIYAEIEQTIRTGTPEEAAAARQQLAALKAAQGGGGPVQSTTKLTERWTRIGDKCSARS